VSSSQQFGGQLERRRRLLRDSHWRSDCWPVPGNDDDERVVVGFVREFKVEELIFYFYMPNIVCVQKKLKLVKKFA